MDKEESGRLDKAIGRLERQTRMAEWNSQPLTDVEKKRVASINRVVSRLYKAGAIERGVAIYGEVYRESEELTPEGYGGALAQHAVIDAEGGLGLATWNTDQPADGDEEIRWFGFIRFTDCRPQEQAFVAHQAVALLERLSNDIESRHPEDDFFTDL